MFTDAITIYNKISDTEWNRTVVNGVQWSDKMEKSVNNGKVEVVKYASITFPKGTYENLTLESGREHDCIVHGTVEDEITGEKGKRVSDILNKYPKSGRIQSVKDNSGKSRLKHIKVVIA